MRYKNQALNMNGFALQIHISRFTLIVWADMVHQELKIPGPQAIKKCSFLTALSLSENPIQMKIKSFGHFSGHFLEILRCTIHK